MATKDTARVNAMLSEFVSSLAQRFSDDLDFIHNNLASVFSLRR